MVALSPWISASSPFKLGSSTNFVTPLINVDIGVMIMPSNSALFGAMFVTSAILSVGSSEEQGNGISDLVLQAPDH